MAEHTVRSWSHLFKPIADGRKLYDLRKNDRNYQVGDKVCLMEYDPVEGDYTGESFSVTITYITDHNTPCAVSCAVLPNDYCILGYKKL